MITVKICFIFITPNAGVVDLDSICFIHYNNYLVLSTEA